MNDHVALRVYRMSPLWLVGLALLLVGCSRDMGPSTLPDSGTLSLSLAVDRTVQYSTSQIKQLDLTLTRTDNSKSYLHSYRPASVGSTFTFSTLNLPIGRYRANLSAYYSTATSSAALVGSTATDSFTIGAGSTTTVKLPSLTLTPTPTGTWPIQVTITVTSFGYSVSQATSSIGTNIGTVVAGPSWTTTNKTFKWQNILAYPSTTSTTSVTVKATRPGHPALTTTKTVSLAVGVGNNATSSLSISI